VVDIRLLGNVEISGDAGVVRLRRSGERCVLAVLAYHATRPVTVATLVDHLWSGTEQSDKSIDTVGTYVRRVRIAITQAGGQAEWLRYDRAARWCLLDIDPAWVDYHRFAALTARARRDNDPKVLQEALALWRGPALADIGGHWADHRRHTLAAERLAAYEDLLHHELPVGQHAEVVRTVTDLVEDSTPTDRLLLLGAHGLADSGQHAAIRGWVARVTQRMRDTVDATPSAGVLDVIDRLIASPAWLSPLAGTVPTAMFSLRADIPTFTGRDDELHALLDTVLAALGGPHQGSGDGNSSDADGNDADGRVRAIAIHTVDGMPGVGKTAFGVHAAHRLSGRFPDGNIFLDLRGHTPGQRPLAPGAALESLLRAAGVDPKMIPSALEDRARLWRDRLAGKKVLLVLDDAADHDQVRPLLPGTAGNLVLITSRHRLAALDGVTSLTLTVLPPDQAIELLVRLAGRSPGSDEQTGIASIVDCCGCLPLAITLAGAQLRSHPAWSTTYLADLLAVEHDRLEHLEVGDRSVRAAFDMSFRHRSAAQQRLFRLLGVHPGPEIDAFAAAALTGDSLGEARRGLAGLHADHLVEETAPGRYRLHDLLRVYARTLATDLAVDDGRDALDRVLTYYQHTVQTANTHLPAFHTVPLPPITTAPAQTPHLDDLSAAREWLAAELPTLTACVHHAAASSNQQPAIHLATALHPFLRLSGYTDQALDIHQTALTAARDLNDHAGQATALTHLGIMQRLRDEYAATDCLTRALALYGTLGDRLGQANALTDLGRVQYQRGDYAVATDSHTRALDLYVAVGDRLGQVTAVTHLGIVQRLRGEYAAATGSLTRALDLLTALGDPLGQATALTHLGIMQRLRGEYAAATGSLTRALDLLTALGDPLGQATALTHLGIVQRLRGEYAAATGSLTRALGMFTAVGDTGGEAETLNNLGDLALDYPEAGDPHTYFSRALTIAQDIGAAHRQAHALAG
jgi:tetratricopeptide (TPR) repeat protein/DNA-binding SARP family transcriptional activator